MSNVYWESFRTFFKIGMFTLGGGYAMIPLIEEEVVNRHRWVTHDEMLDLIAIAQSCPGVFAINISIFIGYKLNKVRGAVASALGTALPSFLIILLVAVFFQQFKDNRYVEAIFRGIRPAVVALIAAPLFKMAKTAMNVQRSDVRSTKERIGATLPLLISLAAALLIWLAHVNPVWIILATIILTLLTQWLKER